MNKLSIIIPANNESSTIGACISAILASDPVSVPVEVIVVANGCSDDTVGIAQSHANAARARGWELNVVDIAEGGKLNALNVGDDRATGAMLVYLDADVIVSPPLMSKIATALSIEKATYASGQCQIAPAESWVSRAYRRFYQLVPFMTQGVPGCGLFAVNRAGRARWGKFPDDIISDDTFVRLQFSPQERHEVDAGYDWPIVEGWRNLVKVRRRQDAGVAEIRQRFPELLANDDDRDFGLPEIVRLAFRRPTGFLVYAAVALAVRRGKQPSGSNWARGR